MNQDSTNQGKYISVGGCFIFVGNIPKRPIGLRPPANCPKNNKGENDKHEKSI